MTVLAGMDAPAIDAPWARELCALMEHDDAEPDAASLFAMQDE